MRNFFLVFTCLFLLTSISALAKDSNNENSVQGPIVIQETHHDISPPFREMTPIPTASFVHRVIPVRPVPLPPGADNAENASHDPNVQTFFGALAIPSTIRNFEGTDEPNSSCNCAPPDTNGSVGPNNYVQLVNTAIAVYDKTGTLAKGYPKALHTLWSGFSTPCSQTDDGDPVVAYDQFADRWIVSQFSVSSAPYHECIAVSTTGDPTGTYARYEFSYNDFNDYPKIGIWPDAYYFTYNLFTNTFVGAETCAMNRTAMLAGTTATQVCFQTSSSFGSLLPATVDGSTVPPAGSPEYVVNFGTNSLNIWRFHVNFTTPSSSTFTGPTNIPVNSFAAACGGGTCIPQAQTKNKLDSLADRLMHRFVYRNFTDHESFIVNHSVLVSKAKGKEIDGVRWYELRNTPPSTSATPSVFQQGTYAPSDGLSRWMGSIAMDKQGNIGLGFSASGPSAFPSIRYTGRLATDPAGQMSQGENVMTAGTGSQTGTLHRWGDYSNIAIDPSDGCTFWYTTEYLQTSGSFNWDTRIGSFKVNSACN